MYVLDRSTALYMTVTSGVQVACTIIYTDEKGVSHTKSTSSNGTTLVLVVPAGLGAEIHSITLANGSASDQYVTLKRLYLGQYSTMFEQNVPPARTLWWYVENNAWLDDTSTVTGTSGYSGASGFSGIVGAIGTSGFSGLALPNWSGISGLSLRTNGLGVFWG